MTEQPEHLNVKEAAAALGKRPETVRRWITAGRLEAERDGAHVRIPAAALAAMKHTCEQCGEQFIPARPGRKPRFCSPRCRWAATHERRKAEHPATRGPGRPPKTQPPRELDLSNERLAAALRRAGRQGAHETCCRMLPPVDWTA